MSSNKLGIKVWWLVIFALAWIVLAPTGIGSQMGPGNGQMMGQRETPGAPMDHGVAATPFYREHTFLVLLGVGIGGIGILAYRAGRSRWRRQQAPAGFASEAVLVVDLVDSTYLATHYGEGLAMRASGILQERTLALAEPHGLLFAKNTGDGCFMTFPRVLDACQTAFALLQDFTERPPDLSPAPSLDLRAGISYGGILMGDGNERHASAINKAFRLEGLTRASFTRVEGESANVNEFPERNRIFLDEEAAQELQREASIRVPLRVLGFARLKGFSGLHRVYEVLWRSVTPPAGEPLSHYDRGRSKSE